MLIGLFCVIVFGLVLWRFRDWYYLLKYRIMGDFDGFKRLVGIYRSWFRLKGLEELVVDVGLENIFEGVLREVILMFEKNIFNVLLMGMRVFVMVVWKLDFVIWFMVMNIFV